jgi:hypothetical protein
MKRVFSSGQIILFILLLAIGVITVAGYIYVNDGLWSSPGLTSKDAREIAPVPKDIKLTAESQQNGIILKWTAKKNLQGNYYDVYRRLAGAEGGWGELVKRTDIKPDSLDMYEFIDNDVETGHDYIYQVILVRISNGFEVKEQASNSIQITYK